MSAHAVDCGCVYCLKRETAALHATRIKLEMLLRAIVEADDKLDRLYNYDESLCSLEDAIDAARTHLTTERKEPTE